MTCDIHRGLFVCGPGPAEPTEEAPCSEPGCPDMGDLLCDWPGRDGDTCDRVICARHASDGGPGMDLCPFHARARANLSEREWILRWTESYRPGHREIFEAEQAARKAQP